MAHKLHYEWQDFTSDDKKELRSLRPIFVLAPREMTTQRLMQLVKEYLPATNIVLGISQEAYVQGFEEQPQFRMLSADEARPIVEKVATGQTSRVMCTLTYPQNEVDDVLRKLKPKSALVVRGSYQFVFHRRSAWHVLQELGIPFSYISPFVDEAEALEYEKSHAQQIAAAASNDAAIGTAQDMLALAKQVAKYSYDYSFQTGCVIAEVQADGEYRPIQTGFNAVIPYQAYALHFGNSREENLSPTHDTNNYDTIHAEMHALVGMMNAHQTMEGKSLCISLLPCPNCARTLSQTGLKEVIYERDHSDGYGAKLFEQCGISVRQYTLNKEAA